MGGRGLCAEGGSTVERTRSENGRSGPRCLHVGEWQVVFGVAGTVQSVRHSPRFPRAAELIIRKLPNYGL